MEYNFNIKNNGVVSKHFLTMGISDFRDACEFIAELPYRRNSNKSDIGCVFKDFAGTCSTKHATLRKLALENDYSEIKLILGIFKMDKIYAPKIEKTLAHYQLDYIPEAHNYLKIGSDYFDFTNSGSQYDHFNENILEERQIEYNQIGKHKVEIHQNFLKRWIKNQSHFTLEKIWKIREQCIQDLQG